MGHRLTREIAERFAGIALGHVTREYPHKTGLVFAGPEDVRPPAAMHPVFHGSFDWHSCVHGYWLLARLLRLSRSRQGGRHPRPVRPAARAGKDSRRMFDLRCPAARGFERPYGWAWLLKLAAELRDAEAPRWGEALAPSRSGSPALHRLPAHRPLPRAGGHAFQHRLRPAPRRRLCRRRPLRAAAEDSAGMVRRRRRLPRLGRARRRRLPVLRPDRGGGDAPAAPGGRLRGVVRPVPAAPVRGPPRDPVHAGHRHRPQRRQDRPSRRAESQPGMVPARPRRGPAAGRSPPAPDAGGRRPAL